MLTFSKWDGTEVLKDLIRDSCLWELINKIGVINSGVKSRERKVLEGQVSGLLCILHLLRLSKSGLAYE
jgi:hypothetical protein